MVKTFSALINLNKNLTQEDLDVIHQILIFEKFRGYDYETKLIIDFTDVLKKYPDNLLYNLRYENETFVISCVKGDNFMTYNIDSNGKYFEIILKVTDSILKSIENSSFTYVDDTGGIPNNFAKFLSKLEIKWLFKYNYFGKDYIEKYGKDFFINMPCVSQEFITEDIIRIDLCKDIFSPIDKSLMKEVSEYLEKFSLKVSFYNHKNFYID